jgi:hypothetical protein
MGGINVSNFIGLMTWRLGFRNGDIKAKMMSPSWNNFLRLFSVLLWLDLTTMKNQG